MYRLKYENVERVVVTEVEKDKLVKQGYILCAKAMAKNSKKSTNQKPTDENVADDKSTDENVTDEKASDKDGK